ncbi:MAG TPA: lectin, partial [Gammaproteobacteria bacterium]
MRTSTRVWATGFLMAGIGAGAHAQEPEMSFFVTSSGLGNGGNLGGIKGADAHCQALARSAGAGAKTWRAYLSVTDLNGKGAINARDRIGRGPWYNANGVRIAIDVDDLHSDSANITADTAITEKGAKLPAEPNQHDILTGSTREGRAFSYNLLDDLNLERGAMTCSNYTSNAEGQFVMVGHYDRAGTAPIS